MSIRAEYVEAIERYGYTPTEARFLYLVATHSGYFTQRQFFDFAGVNRGGMGTRLTMKALAHGHIRTARLARHTLIYNLFARPFYESIEKDKQRCPNSSPEAFIFPNKKDGFMDSNNYRKRVLHRLAPELELPKLTFQVIRRTIATLAQKKGTVKDIQGVLRHSRTATTTDVYMQEIPESVQKTVDAISAELRLLPSLEEVTPGTNVLLPNATKLKSGVSVNT
jgi:hypothetical protein